MDAMREVRNSQHTITVKTEHPNAAATGEYEVSRQRQDVRIGATSSPAFQVVEQAAWLPKTTGHAVEALQKDAEWSTLLGKKGLEVKRKSFFWGMENSAMHTLHSNSVWRRVTEQMKFSLCYYFPLEGCYIDREISYKEYTSREVVLLVGLFLKLCCTQRILISCKMQF